MAKKKKEELFTDEMHRSIFVFDTKVVLDRVVSRAAMRKGEEFKRGYKISHKIKTGTGIKSMYRSG